MPPIGVNFFRPLHLSKHVIKLETTIISCANGELTTLQNPPAEWDFGSRLDYTGAYQAVMALCQLGHIQDSGLSSEAIAALEDIEAQAKAVFVNSGVMQ